MTTISSSNTSSYSDALLRVLKVAGVKYIRFLALDVANNPRVKTVPLSHLQRSQTALDQYQIQIASVCLAGLPSYGDYMQLNSGLDARGTVVLEPDLATLRILPYAPTAALVLGHLRDLGTGEPSDLCARTLLQRVVQTAATQHKLGISVGAELEFTLFSAKTNQPVDPNHFAHSRLLNEQQDFLAELYDQLVDHQEIPIELLHVESGPGQVEVVLQHCHNPVELADRVLLARETISSLARAHGMKAVFLPKIDPMKAGSGCHLHVSMYDTKTNANVFGRRRGSATSTESGYELVTEGPTGEISAVGQSFMEGVLQHMPALLALTLPTTNSFRRVGSGCWTGSTVNWSFDDKESPLRIVANAPAHVGAPAEGWNHFEYKVCDSTANLYLALAGLLACGLNGVETKAALRPHRYQDGSETVGDAFPETVSDALDLLEKDELLKQTIPEALLKGYLAIRRAEADRGAEMTMEGEVQEALNLA